MVIRDAAALQLLHGTPGAARVGENSNDALHELFPQLLIIRGVIRIKSGHSPMHVKNGDRFSGPPDAYRDGGASCIISRAVMQRRRENIMPPLDFKRILCPVDLSGFSLEALKLAVKIARASKSALYLLHVIDNPYDDLYMSSITRADPALLEVYQNEPLQRARVLAATERHSEILLKQFSHDWVRGVPNVRYLIESGDPFEAIVDAAEERRADLIVLATHGRTGIRRLIIGTVAEKVVRHAPCPVLIVMSRAEKRRTAGK